MVSVLNLHLVFYQIFTAFFLDSDEIFFLILLEGVHWSPELRERRRFLVEKWVIVFLVSVCVLSFGMTTYRYNRETGRWERKIDTSGFFSPIQTVSSLVPPTAPQGAVKGGQWYYWMEYSLHEGEKSFTLWAGKTVDVGVVTVQTDGRNLRIDVELWEGYLATESHLDVALAEPTGNQVPGHFPYKTTYNPATSSFSYEVPLSEVFAKNRGASETFYILLHAKILANGGEETAWGGKPSDSFWVGLSGTNLNWFVRKPGVYVIKAMDIQIKTKKVLQVIVSVQNPSNEKGELETLVGISSGRDLPTNWQKSLFFSTYSGFAIWQKVIVSQESICTYRGTGTITFSITNCEVHIDGSPER